MKRMKIINYLGLSLFSLFILLLCGGTVAALDLPKVIDKTNCSQYKELFIPAMYRAVERGDMIVTPGTINFKYKHMDTFIAASAKNAGKFDISLEGDLVEKSTGKIPLRNIYGFPFPNIDLKDPKVGSKIILNFDYQIYRLMGSKLNRGVTWINTSGEERYIRGFDYRLYMTGRPSGHEISKNPDHVLKYEFQEALEPMSLKGTNTMSVIYMDPRDDSNYAYVPAIRRVRRTGSTTRSDPYMGSDSWMDMNYMWSGKDRSMTWKYVGEKTILVGFTNPNMMPAEELPDGRLTMKFPYTGRYFKFGFQVPGWKGAAWAPATGVITYVPRKVWVVEQMPKDPYYSWGLHINYIDQETYTIWYKEVYDKSGQFRTWVSYFLHYSEAASGKNNTGNFDQVLYIDEKVRHASLTTCASHADTYLYIPESKLSSDFFSLNNFILLSK